jgi:hypothetical protein
LCLCTTGIGRLTPPNVLMCEQCTGVRFTNRLTQRAIASQGRARRSHKCDPRGYATGTGSEPGASYKSEHHGYAAGTGTSLAQATSLSVFGLVPSVAAGGDDATEGTRFVMAPVFGGGGLGRGSCGWVGSATDGWRRIRGVSLVAWWLARGPFPRRAVPNPWCQLSARAAALSRGVREIARG